MVRSAIVVAFVLGLAPVSALSSAALAQTSAIPAVAQPPLDESRDGKPGPFAVVPGVGPNAGVVVMLESQGAVCQYRADAYLAGLGQREEAIEACNVAINSGVMAKPDLAAAHVNRGTLYMADDQGRALREFDRAIDIAPELSDAYTNRGMLKVAQGDIKGGQSDLDRAIQLGPRKPEFAYYHRGLAREQQGDVKGAYADYKMAAQIAPLWDKPTAELTRFTVVRR